MTIKLTLMGFLCGAAIASTDRWVHPLSGPVVLGIVAVIFAIAAYLIYQYDMKDADDGYDDQA